MQHREDELTVIATRVVSLSAADFECWLEVLSHRHPSSTSFAAVLRYRKSVPRVIIETSPSNRKTPPFGACAKGCRSAFATPQTREVSPPSQGLDLTWCVKGSLTSKYGGRNTIVMNIINNKPVKLTRVLTDESIM